MLVSEVVDRTYSEWLEPAGIDRPALDFLTSTFTTTTPAIDGTFTVEGAVQNIPPSSVLEIDSELILTKTFVSTTGTVAERGFRDSAPAVHAIGAQVRVDPKYPRLTLLHHLQSLIGMLRPWGLYRRGTDTTQDFTTSGVLPLPAGAQRILSILVRSSGSTEVYKRLKREGIDWELYREFDPPKYRMLRGGGVGNDMVVTYMADFIPPSTESDDLTTLGVSITLQPYLPLAVAGMALQSREIPRVQVEEIRRMLATNGIQVGTALNVGQSMLRAFHMDYVFAERRRQTEQDPPSLVWARTE